MRKNYFLSAIVFILCWLILSSFLTRTCLAENENLLVNGGFETVDSQNRSLEWGMDYWKTGSELVITDRKVHSGKYAACLQSAEENDVRLIQNVPVLPETIYRFSGWVATENIRSPIAGASLSVIQGMVRSKSVMGKNEWEPLELVFRTDKDQHEVTLAVRLGFYGETVTGTAYFDDLRLEKMSSDTSAYTQINMTEAAPLVGKTQFEHPIYNQAGLKLNTDLTPGWFDESKLLPLTVIYFIFLVALIALHKSDFKFLKRTKRLQAIEKYSWQWFLGIAIIALLIRIPGYNLSAPFPLKTGWFLLPVFFEMTSIIKMIGFICDVGTAFILFRLVGKKQPLFGLVLSGLFLMTPSIIMNAIQWGGWESAFVLFLTLSLFELKRENLSISAVCWCLSATVKFEAFLILPLLFIYLYHRKGFKKSLIFITQGCAVWLLLIGGAAQGNLFNWAIKYFSNSSLPFQAAETAANFQALIGGYGVGETTGNFFGLNYAGLGIILFLLFGGWGSFYFWKKRTFPSLITGITLTLFAWFLFGPRMQVTELLAPITLLWFMSGLYRDKRVYFFTVILSLAFFLNLHAVSLNKLQQLIDPTFSRAIYIVGLINFIVFGFLLFFFQLQSERDFRSLKQTIRIYNEKIRNSLVSFLGLQPFKLVPRDYLLIALITFGYAFVIFARLGSWSTPMTGINFTSDQVIEIQLTQTSNIRTIVLYDAEDSGQFAIDRQSNGLWSNVGTVVTDGYYVLKRQSLVADEVSRIRLVPKNTAGMINEIGFLDERNQLIAVDYVLYSDGRKVEAKKCPLFDEQRSLLERPSYMNSTYFDEIYHGRTAYEFIKRYPVYETTHPPFGKDLLSLGILLFGMNPFGMRFIHALMGVLLIIALFFLGRQILATRFAAFATMIAGCLDFMPFVESRYSTIDTTSVFFITLMFIFTFRLIREQTIDEEAMVPLSYSTMCWLFLSFALAVATKWTGAYAFVGSFGCFAVLKVRQFIQYREQRKQVLQRTSLKKTRKDHSRVVAQELAATAQKISKLSKEFWLKNFIRTVIGGLLLFCLIVPLTYYLTYIPFLKCANTSELFTKASVKEVVASQQGMFDYHHNLKDAHPFSSSWWSWPFNFKPLWIYSGNNPAPGMKDSIVSMGNPLIWLLGLCGFVFISYHLLKIRRLSIVHYVLICILAGYMPWVLVERVTFIYHFYPVLPLLYVLIAMILNPLWGDGNQGRKVIFYLFAAALILWGVFYPVLSGWEVPAAYIDRLHWFPRDWVF